MGNVQLQTPPKDWLITVFYKMVIDSYILNFNFILCPISDRDNSALKLTCAYHCKIIQAKHYL